MTLEEAITKLNNVGYVVVFQEEKYYGKNHIFVEHSQIDADFKFDSYLKVIEFAESLR